MLELMIMYFVGSSNWINQSIIQNQSNPIVGVFATDQANAPWAFGFLYFAIYASVVILLSVRDPKFVKYEYASFIMMLVAFVFAQANLLPANTVIIPIAIFGLLFLASFFFD